MKKILNAVMIMLLATSTFAVEEGDTKCDDVVSSDKQAATIVCKGDSTDDSRCGGLGKGTFDIDANGNATKR
jgi:hypothetical protein